MERNNCTDYVITVKFSIESERHKAKGTEGTHYNVHKIYTKQSFLNKFSSIPDALGNCESVMITKIHTQVDNLNFLCFN